MGDRAAVQELQAPTVPPQNLDAEESVLGAMMLSPGAIAAVSEILSSDGREFYRESHAKIYRAALALYAKGEPVDAITLVDEIDERGELEDVGGKVRIHELAALVPAAANSGHYARIVHESATLRGLIHAGGEIARLGWDRPGDTTELVGQSDRVHRLALDVQAERGAIDLRVALPVELAPVAREDLAHHGDRAGREHHGAEHGFLCVEVLGRDVRAVRLLPRVCLCRHRTGL